MYSGTRYLAAARRFLLIDQQFIEGEDVVFVAHGAGIGGIDVVNMIGPSITVHQFVT
jgi:hypothetical protein